MMPVSTEVTAPVHSMVTSGAAPRAAMISDLIVSMLLPLQDFHDNLLPNVQDEIGAELLRQIQTAIVDVRHNDLRDAGRLRDHHVENTDGTWECQKMILGVPYELTKENNNEKKREK